MSENLLCSVSECKQRGKDAQNMSYEELSKYIDRCGSCGVWIFKETEQANQTYKHISNLWAIKHNEKFMGKK